MEARQFRRYAEGREDREREVQEELASLSDLAASYHSRLQSHGIDPDSFSDDGEEEQHDEEDGEEVEQIDTAALQTDGSSGGDSIGGMQVKAMVDDDEEEQFTPVEKEFEYTVDVRCASSTTKVSGAVVVGEFMGEGNAAAGGLYARVEALEADRAAMRREIAALRAERAQLVMARAMARRLCREVVAEQKAKKVAASPRSFSVLGVCKKLTVLYLFAAVGALDNLLEKQKFHSQVYLRSVNYVPWLPTAARQIHHVESLASSA
ncbi:hypothetical protein OsJ_12889 [Oryza sativa Japonica Group]|uniref:GTD-binding domain-containing protein n=2 Tax=Oryza sativa TaxID=4530 RepID=A3ANG3_ORYSJ|nr:hypothetical protein OsJ_12889 [Oryza sativa Japonica Group]